MLQKLFAVIETTLLHLLATSDLCQIRQRPTTLQATRKIAIPSQLAIPLARAHLRPLTKTLLVQAIKVRIIKQPIKPHITRKKVVVSNQQMRNLCQMQIVPILHQPAQQL